MSLFVLNRFSRIPIPPIEIGTFDIKRITGIKKRKQKVKDIIYYSDDSYLGEGISLGIVRGILVKYKDRSFARHKKYQEFWKSKTGDKPATIMMTKGCPFNCDFCSKPIFGNKLRKRSISDCIKEILYIKSLGYNQLWIADDCFTLDDRFLNNFCQEMIEKRINMT